MTEYEYKVINPEELYDGLEEALNKLGKDGWKAVAMANASYREPQLILMREIK